MINLLTPPFLILMDFIFSLIPRRRPSEELLKNTKIVAHRGWHNGSSYIENTVKSFDKCVEEGIWGIELDIRWTKDLVPVVHHDANCERVWSKTDRICDLSFAELRSLIPKIPSFEEVISRYSHKIHLLFELKWEIFPNIEKQRKVLEVLLSKLEPIKDYHLLGLNEKTLREFDNFPSNCKILVGDINIYQFSKISLINNYSGVAGHFALIPNAMIKKQHNGNQTIGTAYIKSKNSLYREITRGVDHIYTNHPWILTKILNNDSQ